MIERETNFVLGSSDAQTETVDTPEVRRGPAGTAMQPDVRGAKPVGPNEGDERTELLPPNEAQELRSRWDKIQTSFVDEPRRSVKEADTLVAETIKRLSETFTQARARMEQDLDRGDSASTENLRMALRRYRSFFTRLLEM
jgi:hypothetical protein